MHSCPKVLRKSLPPIWQQKILQMGQGFEFAFSFSVKGVYPIRGRIARWDPMGRYRIDFNRIARNPGPSRNLDAVADRTELVVAH